MSVRVGASTGYWYDSTSAPVADAPITMAAWLNIQAFADPSNNTVVGLNGGTLSAAYIFARRSGSNYTASAYVQTDSFTAASAAGTVAISLNTWTHVCATFVSNTERNIFVGGTLDATNTTNRNPADFDKQAIGTANPSSDYQIADAAMWNAELSDEEIARLALGFSARFVRPDSLVSYAPLVNGAVFIDPFGYTNLPAVNTPAAGASHPPIIGAIAV